FAQAPWYALPVHLCRFGVRSTRGLFPGTPTLPAESSNREQLSEFVTTHWPTNINVVPIDYAFRPRLRDRLTLRRLTLRRNPWTFGDSVSPTVCRYSCQHSHFRCLQRPSQVRLHKLTERSATIRRTEDRCQTTDSDSDISHLSSESQASARGLSPVTFSAP